MDPSTPLGHSRSAHQLHGFCALCQGRTLVDEVAASRTWAIQLPGMWPAEEGPDASGQ